MAYESVPDLDAYFAEQGRPRPRYTSQLDPQFQLALARRYWSIAQADCEFPQTLQFADGSVVPGVWDLRGHEDAYLGNFPLWGKRILQYGPGSGWIAAHVAARARDLVLLDLPPGGSPPQAQLVGLMPEIAPQSVSDAAERVRRGFWFAKQELGFEASVVYADFADPPTDIGRVDAAILPLILCQNPNPYRVLQGAGAIADEAIVITELMGPVQVGSGESDAAAIAVFAPTPLPDSLHHWWQLTPVVVCRMATALGFIETTVTVHSPPRMQPAPLLFTVVARRPRRTPLHHGGSAETERTPTAPPASPAAEPTAADGLALPPPQARFQAVGNEQLSTFLGLGRRGFMALLAALRRAGLDADELGRVLDFGCGVGRVLRYWHQVPDIEMHGCDIDANAIDWAREHLRFAQFSTNTLEPPLDYPDGHFGVVYALSVFTHLPEELQLPWFRELLRVLRPDGLLYFSTHGDAYRDRLSVEQRAVFDQGGPIVGGQQKPGSSYCSAFHPEAYIRSNLIGRTDSTLVEHVPRGPRAIPTRIAGWSAKHRHERAPLRRRGVRTCGGLPPYVSRGHRTRRALGDRSP